MTQQQHLQLQRLLNPVHPYAQAEPPREARPVKDSMLASAHTAFMENLAGRNTLLASIFTTVEKQSQNNDRWQYIWVGYQYDDDGNLRPDREAHAVFHAHQAADQTLVASGASDQQRTNLANRITSVIAYPHHRAVQEDIRRSLQASSQFEGRDDDLDHLIKEERRLAKDLAFSLNNLIGHARIFITTGLMEHKPREYVRGLTMLDNMADLT